MTQTPTSNRIEIIDIIRGFALVCILLVHFSGEFAGWSTVYTSPVSSAALSSSSVDSFTNFFLNLFLINKARTLFAFLFGVGFYFQLAKANRNGYRIESKFARRMLMLLFIGVLHAYLIWAGDILRFYAVCGLGLLLVYKRSDRSLFIIAVVCSVLIPAMSVLLRYHFPFALLSSDMKVQMYQGLISDNYTNFFQANLLRDLASNWDPYNVCFYLFPIFGNFLFGYLAAEARLFEKLSTNKGLLRRCLLFSFGVGFFGSNSFARLAAKPFGATESDIPLAWRDVLSFFNCLSIECTAFFLLCFLIILYQVPFAKKALGIFAFAGRMTLTNYIMQSLFGVWFFYGVGLGFISRYGPTVAFTIGLGYFIIQLWYSRLWLQYFSTGPVEYLWRSLVEWKWQTIRLNRADIAAQ